MFTGIIEATGHIEAMQPSGRDSRFVFHSGRLSLDDLRAGDSIAVNGACLTIIEKEAHRFTADLSAETLALTTFKGLRAGARVNLEKAMQLKDRINGHLVSGHVDGVGRVLERFDEGRSVRFGIAIPPGLEALICQKGSVTVDGVSLTVNAVKQAVFNVNIIPHTLSQTIIADYAEQTPVNIETDLIARHLARLLAARQTGPDGA